MTRLVVISNRLPVAREADPGGEPEVPAGGLASALVGALRRSPGSLWLGWSGRVVEPGHARRARRQELPGFDLLGFPLTDREVADYYHGYCNGALWPLLHSFPGKARVRLRHEACYREVQSLFAETALPHLGGRDLVWVHDYHLLHLGRELRRRGWRGRTGFFLHTPFPSYDLWQILPDPRDTLLALLEYDLVGFHVPGFLENYVSCARRELGARWDGAVLTAAGRAQRAGVYPVGIDPRGFRPGPREGAGHERGKMLRSVVRGRRLILGVDRLDYTKGIPERILALERLLTRHPEWRRKVVYVQIASPSRTEVPAYLRQRRRVEALMGRVNGELGEHDWTPIRYLFRSYGRDFLAKLYRAADIGLVTPLRDGMNLVAKEYVAAQAPESPGVLVLSRCAGAAEELREAVIVNPYVPADVAEGMHRALSMPIEERRSRQAALLARVMKGTAAEWSRRFLADLEGAPRRHALTAAGRITELS